MMEEITDPLIYIMNNFICTEKLYHRILSKISSVWDSCCAKKMPKNPPTHSSDVSIMYDFCVYSLCVLYTASSLNNINGFTPLQSMHFHWKTC